MEGYPRAAAPDSPMPVKNVVMGTYERFFETSRAQDRIVVYFGGHAVEKNGKAYIAPVEGDFDDEASLIPLSDFYDKLKACKATQKVVIWDVCRYNPQRGRQRPGGEPMTESLHKALAAAPPGVEVVTTCQPGENALEFYNLQVDTEKNAPTFAGSAFLESARYVASKNLRASKQPVASDPIPVAEFVPPVAKRVSEMAAAVDAQAAKTTLKQTVTLHGNRPERLTPPDPNEPAAKRLAFAAAPKGVAPADITEIIDEMYVPPLKAEIVDTALTDLAFRKEVMKAYEHDVAVPEILKNKEKYPLRVATLTAFRLRVST